MTLLTDFGTQDTFVGLVKGVIKSIAPQVDLIDLTHEIPAYDIQAAAFALKTAYRYFPSGTVHLIVVDPGVGSERHPIAAQIGESFYVCPNNGLLSYVLQNEPLINTVVLDKPQYHLPNISRTFHGRDLFAPVAAHLANGTELGDLGTPISELVTIHLSHPIVSDNTIIAHVIYFDHYGNAFTDLTESDFVQKQGHEFSIMANGQAIAGPLSAYSEVESGSSLALFGSSGHLEIAVRNGSAQQKLGLYYGSKIILMRADRQ